MNPSPIFQWRLLFLIALLASPSAAQLQHPVRPSVNNPVGGGEVILGKDDQCVTPEERTRINNMLYQNRSELINKGLLTENRSSLVLFNWPVAQDPTLNFNNAWAISNYVDQDQAGGILDYNCGSRTYNGHFGIDIYTWPFSWYLKENDLVNAVAAAPGTIIGKDDGNVDNHCSCSGSWNAVYIEHTDGSIAWYGHLKLGSLTTKTVGQTVGTGEYLGVIASSGCSTGPHLHFEVYEDTPYNLANLVDPFFGPCNTLNNQTWWNNQMTYTDPTINAVLTHSAAPLIGCPANNEAPNFQDVFIPGQTIYTAFYYKDQASGTTANYSLLRPDGTVYNAWNQTFNSYYSSSYWYWTWVLPSNGPFGNWTLRATYDGVTVNHPFQYLQVPPPVEGVGVNILNPKAELHIHDGALFIDNAAKGIIMKSENGNCYLLKINTSGVLTTQLLAQCPN